MSTVDQRGITTKLSSRSVDETVATLLHLIDAKDLRLFSVIDQRAEATAVGLELRATTLVIFGDPASGTPVMETAPLAALDLPLKVLIWADGSQTKVSYVSPETLASRYDLDDELRDKMAGIDALTSALVAH